MSARGIVASAVSGLLAVGAIRWVAAADEAPRPTVDDTIAASAQGVSHAVGDDSPNRAAAGLLRHEARSASGVEAQAHASTLAAQRSDRRALSAAEKAKAQRSVERLLNAANSPFALQGKSEMEQVVHIAQKLKDRALLSAAQCTLGEGGCFLSKGVDESLRNGDRWHYWNVDFPMREGERRWMQTLYVPVDLVRFPAVADRKARLRVVRDHQRAGEALAWNSKSFAERRELVEQARRAREQCLLLDAQMSSASDLEVRAKLGTRLDELLTLMSRVPRKYDPQTLDWRQ